MQGLAFCISDYRHDNPAAPWEGVALMGSLDTNFDWTSEALVRSSSQYSNPVPSVYRQPNEEAVVNLLDVILRRDEVTKYCGAHERERQGNLFTRT